MLPADRAAQTQELSLAYVDALAASARWQDIKDALTADRLRLDPVARRMYLGTARMKTNEPEGADVEWQRAQEAAGKDGGKLATLAAFEDRVGAFAAADSAYAAAIAAAPEQRASYTARGELALRRGQTALARELWAEISRQWPGDTEARAKEAYFDLLLGSAGIDANRDGQAAKPLALRQPADWSARATLALARLREGQAFTVLAAFSGDRGTMDPQAQPGADVPSGARAVWAVTLAANGWHTEAERAAHQVADTTLLPEERALIAPLLTPAARP